MPTDVKYEYSESSWKQNFRNNTSRSSNTTINNTSTSSNSIANNTNSFSLSSELGTGKRSYSTSSKT